MVPFFSVLGCEPSVSVSLPLEGPHQFWMQGNLCVYGLKGF